MSNFITLKDGRWLLDVSEIASVFMTQRQDYIRVALKRCEEIELYYDNRLECSNDYKTVVEAVQKLQESDGLTPLNG